jgi:hypothetical protein
MNFFSFSYSYRVLNLLILKENFAGYSNLGWLLSEFEIYHFMISWILEFLMRGLDVILIDLPL